MDQPLPNIALLLSWQQRLGKAVKVIFMQLDTGMSRIMEGDLLFAGGLSDCQADADS